MKPTRQLKMKNILGKIKMTNDDILDKEIIVWKVNLRDSRLTQEQMKACMTL